jgi:predicted component of type VI protein secretion system
MISKETAKKRMYAKFDDYGDRNELLLALVRQDQVTLDKYKSMDDRISSYNSKMESDVDAADDDEFQRLVSTWQGLVESPV